LAILKQLLNDGLEAFRELSPLDRFFRIFWLSGPFMLLIERTPADIWLSTLSLAFVARSIINRDGAWLKVTWVRAFFGFWLVCIVSATASSHPFYSVGETVIWARFPIFVVATIYWLGTDRRLIQLMLMSSVIGMLAMAGILIAEFIFTQGTTPRLSWPYGNLTPGNYIAKASIVALLALYSLGAIQSNFALNFASKLGVGVVLFALFLTGERINFILCISALVLVGVLNFKNSKKLGIGAITIVLLAALIGGLAAPDRLKRFEPIVSTFAVSALSAIFEKTSATQKTCLWNKETESLGSKDLKLGTEKFYTLLHVTPMNYSDYYFSPNWRLYKDGEALIEVSTADCKSNGPAILKVATTSPSPSLLFLSAKTSPNALAKKTNVNFLVRSSSRGSYRVELVSEEGELFIERRYEISEPNSWHKIELSFSPDEFPKHSFQTQQNAELRFQLSSFNKTERLSNAIGESWELADLEVISDVKKTEAIGSHHLEVIKGGLVAFKQSPILGVGPGVYRVISPDLLAGLDGVASNNHPHNFVVQLLAETGVLGAFLGCSLILLIWVDGWRLMRRNPYNDLLKICFVVPFALFWPISTQADFFGQWNNLFLWSAVALALSLRNMNRVELNEKSKL